MTDDPVVDLRVAIACDSEKRRRILKMALERTHGIDVVASTALTEAFLEQINRNHADILLVDVQESGQPDWGLMQVLLAKSGLPVIFNDMDVIQQPGLTQDKWISKLVEKMVALVVETNYHSEPPQKIGDTSEEEKDLLFAFRAEVEGQKNTNKKADIKVKDREKPTLVLHHNHSLQENPPTITVEDNIKLENLKQEKEPPFIDEDIFAFPEEEAPISTPHPIYSEGRPEIPYRWILGASIGGPQAVKDFLAALPVDCGLAFLLVQHIGINFVDLLAEQLARNTGFVVSRVKSGDTFEAGKVMVMPTDESLEFDIQGRVRLKPLNRHSFYNPCIDDVLEEAAQRFGENIGAIIFSGMGNDGTRGARILVKNGGCVWAQDAQSCIISSMPDSVRKEKVVSYSAPPEQLALNLMFFFKRQNEMMHGVQ